MITSRQDTTPRRYKRVADILFWCLLLGGCAVFLLMNLYTPLKEDDIFHSYIGGGSGRPTNTLLDVLRSWVAYYRYDARMANIISFTFNGILGKTVFNVVNTLVFGVFAYLLSRITTRRNSAMVLVMLYTYMVTAMPVPGETLLWPTAAFNYLWAFTASMLFIIYLLKHRNPRPGWLMGIVVFLVSMFVGGINEGTVFGVFGGLVMYYLFNRDKVDRAVAIAMAGYMTGVLILLTCPGAWDRASLEVSHEAGILTLLSDRLRILWNSSCHFITPLAAVAVILIGMLKDGIKKTFNDHPFTWVFLVLLAFTVVVGKEQLRLYFSVSMAGFILLVMAIDRLLERAWWLRLAVIAVGLALCVKYYPPNIATMKRYQTFFNDIENDIRQSSDRQVILPTGEFKGYSRFIKYFNFDSWTFFIREETLCYYYDKDNIQFVPDSIYNRFHNGRLLDGAQPMAMEAPDCPDVEAILAIPGQDYWAVKMHQDTISHSYQFAQAYQADGTPIAAPIGYFPLLYQGHEYLIFPPLDDAITRLEFSPYALDGTPITLHRAPTAAEQ
ncbi:MAG: hypothetical protein IJK41_01660 [Muribaculaceae bacterium]|nr:hypothetical protein [Muribaculaceae bacterium]